MPPKPKKSHPARKRTLRGRFSAPSAEPRLRIICETVGPGKAQLLELLSETCSISESARRMSMSYPRAWALVETLNRTFSRPLVESATGGSRGGGSRLTVTGKLVLQLYHRIHAHSLSATRSDLLKLHRLLKH
jgi:molybdate transport system regulatory protein